jgi:hypothetical protein
MLKTKCQVQHAPWDVSDGGAGSTAQGQACLDNFLKTQNQTAVFWDVILFNFGLHNLNDTTPEAQHLYREQLTDITQRLLHHYDYDHHKKATTNKNEVTLEDHHNDENGKMPQLIYATTTPFMPLATKGEFVVDQLNKIALEVMTQVQEASGHSIHVLDMNLLVHSHCGSLYYACDWCELNPCGFHYNQKGKAAQGIFAAAAMEQALTYWGPSTAAAITTSY